jgi:hypothetical protein
MPNESHILPNVSVAGLTALADAVLAPKMHAKLDDLLTRNADGALSAKELNELDAIIEQIDELNLLKARAEYTLRQQDQINGQ